MVSHLAARVQRISHRASNYREITSRLKSLHRWNPQQHSKKQRDHNSSASRLRSASSASSVSSASSSSTSSCTSSASVLEKEQKKKNTEICREQKDEDEDVLENTEQEENLNNKYNKYEDDDDAGYASSSSVSSRSSTSSSHPNNPNPNPNSNRVYGPLTEPLDAYDYVFWLGDLNYRVHLKSKDLSMKESLRGEKEEDEKGDKKDVVYGCDTAEEYREVLRLVNGHEWSLLQRNDQLTREMSFENVFCGYNEEKIIFAPTYRMNKGKSGYSNKRYHQQQEIICRIVNSLFSHLFIFYFLLLVTILLTVCFIVLLFLLFLFCLVLIRNQSMSYTDRILYKFAQPSNALNHQTRLYDGLQNYTQSDHRPTGTYVSLCI